MSTSGETSGVITIERHILLEQAAFPDASGALTQLLYDIALAGKLIASRTTRAGLADILGSAGHENVQGEDVQKLDAYAQKTIFQLNDHTGRLAVMASEEEKDIIPIPGTKRSAHLEENVMALDIVLEKGELDVLDHATRPGLPIGERDPDVELKRVHL